MSVTAVERCFALLDAFEQGEPSAGLSQLARRTGLAPSTAHRLLATLIESGWVEAVGGGKYRLGIKAWQVGCRAVSQLDVPAAAQPELESLAAESGETVHVSVLQGTNVVYVARIASRHRVAAQTYLGQSAPAASTATGRALLAFAPPGSVDPDASARLEEVRRTGISRAHEEWQAGLAGVAAPIFDQSGYAVAAIGVAGPSQRFTGEAVERYATLVREAAARASERLGHLPLEVSA